MKTFWKRIVSVLLCLSLAAAPILMTACSNDKPGGGETKSEYTVIYDLDYEDSPPRTGRRIVPKPSADSLSP